MHKHVMPWPNTYQNEVAWTWEAQRVGACTLKYISTSRPISQARAGPAILDIKLRPAARSRLPSSSRSCHVLFTGSGKGNGSTESRAGGTGGSEVRRNACAAGRYPPPGGSRIRVGMGVGGRSNDGRDRCDHHRGMRVSRLGE